MTDMQKDPAAYLDEIQRRVRMAKAAGALSPFPRPSRRSAVDQGAPPPIDRLLGWVQGKPEGLMASWATDDDPAIVVDVNRWRAAIRTAQARQRVGLEMFGSIFEDVPGSSKAAIRLMNERAVLNVFCPMHRCDEPLGRVFRTGEGLVWQSVVEAVPNDEIGGLEPWAQDWMRRNLDDELVEDDEALAEALGRLHKCIMGSIFSGSDKRDRFEVVTYEPLTPILDPSLPPRLWARCRTHPEPPVDVAEHIPVGGYRTARQPARILLLDVNRLIEQATAATDKGTRWRRYEWRRAGSS